ncbi:hypothetical protein F444_08824 [Phytophthora nicotianae P1976]|uniref:Uncharacterized protein n=1 Tax=Phytophthora nicotianae P1976 TaxID=1317066 RepID=A0A081A9Q8_PHYNI|nr:hypothetical protein F444_08824 [Phytophthora nicotianae P1976]
MDFMVSAGISLDLADGFAGRDSHPAARTTPAVRGTRQRVGKAVAHTRGTLDSHFGRRTGWRRYLQAIGYRGVKALSLSDRVGTQSGRTGCYNQPRMRRAKRMFWSGIRQDPWSITRSTTRF